MKKIISVVLFIVLTVMLTSSALAASFSSLESSSSSGGFLNNNANYVREKTAFSLTSGSAYTPQSARKLTVRPYQYDAYYDQVKLSNAKTYSADTLSGGQTYWSLPVHLQIKMNTDVSGLVRISGSWKF
ncbi:MAG TPA: hypothetical protein PKA81_14350 [Clostridia bacterium]|nr:hypothetical protein [Clostridia bacterium]